MHFLCVHAGYIVICIYSVGSFKEHKHSIGVIMICCVRELQIFLGQSGGLDSEGNELPRLVYVSREKRPGFEHHKKAGAMNALVSIALKLLSSLSLLLGCLLLVFMS